MDLTYFFAGSRIPQARIVDLVPDGPAQAGR